VSRRKKDSYNDEMRKRLESFEPRVVSPNDDGTSMRREALSGTLPDGYNLDDTMKKDASGFFGAFNSMGGSAGGGGSMFHAQRPYLPEYESPDRYYFPKDRSTANRYWRMFYRDDPMLGTAVEMYSGMCFSDFDIIFENENDKNLRHLLEDMCDEVSLLSKLQEMVREYLVLGESFPHTIFNKSKGVWTHLNLMCPDNLEVIDSPLFGMGPIISYIPDDNLVRFFNDTSKESREIQKKYPQELVSKIRSKQKIRLDDKHVSFIPRKMHPYDVRGTSICTRLWRTFMIEDAVANSTIATFRRASAPIKAVLIGDPNLGYYPTPEQEAKVAKMLAQCELDPQSYFIYHHAIKFELWGDPSRTITYGREFDTIEKLKLMALGLSKSFISGETTYASSKSGLQVFLRRLLSLRQYFESVWIYPRFIDPIIQVNDLQKSTPSEVRHRYRIRRTAQEVAEKNLLIRPKILWRNNLDAKVDVDLLQALGQIKNYGFPVSETTIGSCLNLDPVDEIEKKAVEFKKKREAVQKTLGDHMSKQFYSDMGAAGAGQVGAKPPGQPGSGAKPMSGPKTPPPQGTQSAPPGSNEGGGSELGADAALDEPIDRGITTFGK
jgi:hypothetical protein